MNGLSRKRRRIHCRAKSHLYRRSNRDIRLRIHGIGRNNTRISRAHSRTITHCAAILRTHRPEGQGRILRYTCIANIVGALLSIVRNIRVVDDRREVAHAVTLFFLTVSGHLIGERCAGGGVRESAHTAIARAGGAFGVHSGAIGARAALDTRTCATERPAVLGTRTLIWFVWVRRYSIETNIVRALVAIVDGRVVVVGRACDAAGAIANEGLAIACSLSGRDRRAHWGIVHAALVQATRAHLAFGVLAWTIRRNEAFDAGASSVAQRAAILIAHRACG